VQNDENVKRVLTFALVSLIIVSRGEAKRVPTQAGSSHRGGVGAGPTNKSVDPDWYAEPVRISRGLPVNEEPTRKAPQFFLFFSKKVLTFGSGCGNI
jgi:hypothetical protein